MDNTVRWCPLTNISNHSRTCSGQRRTEHAEICDRTMGEAPLASLLGAATSN